MDPELREKSNSIDCIYIVASDFNSHQFQLVSHLKGMEERIGDKIGKVGARRLWSGDGRKETES